MIDQTGRIVTAFPSAVLKGLAVTAVGVAAFTERTAEAGEAVRESVQQENALRAAAERQREEESSSWWEWVPVIGLIYGGSLNSGEDAEHEADLEAGRRDALVAQVVADAVADIEADKRRPLVRPSARMWRSSYAWSWSVGWMSPKMATSPQRTNSELIHVDIALAYAAAGRVWGLGRTWAKLPFVDKHRWLS